jgi:hypothetical protein
VKNQKVASTIILVALTIVILLLSTASFSVAQNPQQLYPGGDEGVVTDITIDENGLFNETVTKYRITYTINGTPGSTGTVTTIAYNGNPHPTADIPFNVELTKFIVVTFDFDSNHFIQATLTFSYTDSDVAGLKEPFVICKYIAEADLYVQLESVVDATAKTITIILNSTEDPLFGIGGTTDSNTNNSSFMIWIAVSAAVIITVVAVFLVSKKYVQ